MSQTKKGTDLLAEIAAYVEAHPPRKCRVCRLGPDVVKAVDANLRNGVSKSTLAHFLKGKGYSQITPGSVDHHSDHVAE